MNIAYVRVSTIDQHEDRQVEGLEKYKIDRWFIEKVSAKDTDRPELKKLIDFAREGDVVHIHSFDRIARNVKDLLTMVEDFKKKGVHLVSNKENIDTGTPTGMLMLTMLGAIAEFERTNMLERQREGIAIAKAKGVYKGRKEIDFPSNWEEIYPKWKNRELTGTAAMEQLNLKRNTFYKLIKKYEENN